MRAKLIYMLVSACLIIQNCSDSTSEAMPSLDRNTLQTVVESNSKFHSVVNAHVNFLHEIDVKYGALTETEKDELNKIAGKAGSVENFIKYISTMSPSELNLLVKISGETSKVLPILYTNLIDELNLKYKFNTHALQEIIIDQVVSKRSKAGKNSRAMSSCTNHCDNAAERYYWYIYNATGNSDIAAGYARSFHNGCMEGCAIQ